MAGNNSDDKHAYYLDQKCNIKDIQLKGVKKTNRNVLCKIVADIFETETLAEFVANKVAIIDKLEELDAFSDINVKLVYIDKNDFDVTIHVKERGPISGSIRTDMDANSNYHLFLKAKFPNLNGIGDEAGFSTRFNKGYYFLESRYSVPLTPWRKLWAPRYSVFFNFNTWDHMPSNYDQKDKALTNLIEFNSSPQLRHTISYENVWRALKSSSLSTPLEIRKFSGHSFKSALKYVLTWDNRDDYRFHHNGCLLKFSNEATTDLVENGAKFLRHELHFQFNKNILPKLDLLCQLNLAGGLLYPIKTSICDRFFVGGPLNLRGFKLHGLGPNVQGSPLGGDTYFSAGVHVYPPMPYSRDLSEFIRPQFFVNTGTIGNWKDLKWPTKKEDIKRELHIFKDSLRLSCGLGLVLRFGQSIRLELNYSVPLVTQSCDLSSGGLQFGFGLNI